MYNVKFDTGETVSFQNQPTDQDIEEVVKTLGIKPKSATIPSSSVQPQNNGESGLGGFSTGVAKGEISTVKGLGSLGETILNQTAGRVVNAIRGKGFVPTNQNIYGKGGTMEQKLGDKLQPKGAAENLGFGAEKVAEFAVPGTKVAGMTEGAGLLARSVADGVTGGGIAAIQNGAVDKNAITTGAVSAALPGVGAGLNKIGGALTEYLPKRLIQSAIGQSKKELMAGKDISSYVLSKGKFGTADGIINSSQEAISSLSKTIGDNLKSSSEIINRNDVLQKVVDVINEQGGQIKKQEVYDNVVRIAPQVKGLLNKKTLTLAEANKLRQSLDQTLGDRGFLTSQLPYSKTILRLFDNNLRGSVQELAPAGTKDMFKELSKEITLRDSLLERVSSQARNQPLNGFDLLLGSGGFLGGGPVGAAMSVAAKKAIQSVIGKTGIAQILDYSSKLGPILNKLAPEEKAFIQSLISGGGQSDSSPSSGGQTQQ